MAKQSPGGNSGFAMLGAFAGAVAASLVGLYAISSAVDGLTGYGRSDAPAMQQAAETAPAVAPAPAAAPAEPAAVAEPTTPAPAVNLADETKIAENAAGVASDAPPPVDMKKHPGRTAYLRKGACAACHGRNGDRGISYYPSIAGQDKLYIVNQLNDILNKKRVGGIDPANNHPRTESMVGALVAPDGSFRVDPTDIDQMADWLSKSPAGKPLAPEAPIDPASAAAGETLYKKCIACHGKEGNKPLKGYPYLAGQKRIYLVQQMVDIRDGIRTNGKVKVMLPFVKKLTDAEIGSLADYLSQIDRSAN